MQIVNFYLRRWNFATLFGVSLISCLGRCAAATGQDDDNAHSMTQNNWIAQNSILDLSDTQFYRSLCVCVERVCLWLRSAAYMHPRNDSITWKLVCVPGSNQASLRNHWPLYVSLRIQWETIVIDNLNALIVVITLCTNYTNKKIKLRSLPNTGILCIVD